MNLALSLIFNGPSTKRLIIIVAATTVGIMALPIGAVLALTNLPLLAISSSSSSTGGTIYNGPIMSEDTYDYGYCTYWAALRRIQIGDPIPNDWGNAITWAFDAQLAGYKVDHTPSYGAIFQWPQAPGGLGHVAFVESVDPTTGAWTISEMNALGWDVVNDKTYPASAASDYNFIHDRVNNPSTQP